MAHGRIIGARRFAALERALARELAAAEPWRPVWVLVPTNLLGLHLRRAFGRALGGLMGVEFLTLHGAAARLALPTLAAHGKRPVPPGADALTVRRLLADEPRGTHFGQFREFRNAPDAVLRAVQVLEASRWTPEALQQAAGRAGLGRTDAERLRALAALWEWLRCWRAEQAFFAPDELLAEAAREGATPAETPERLVLYGFYDLTPAQRALVGRLAQLARSCTACLLWEGRDGRALPAFRYAEPTVNWLKSLLGVTETEAAPDGGTSDLARLAGGLFADWPFLGPDEAQARLEGARGDGTVQIVSCPGDDAEAREAVREVLRAAEDEGGDAGVLLRAPDGTLGLLGEALDRADVRFYAREGMSVADTPTARVALALLDAEARHGSRAESVALCSLLRFDWPEDLSAAALDRLSREAGIVSGGETWEPLLRARARALAEHAQHADDEADRTALAHDARLSEVAAGWAGETFGQLDFSHERTWAAFSRKLAALTAKWTPEDAPDAEPVLEIVRGLHALDATGVPADPEVCRWVLGGLLARESRRRGRFQHVGVTMSTVMGSRGVTYDTVLVPGLVERGFPRRLPEEPLVTESDRAALNEAADALGCGELPLRARQPDEERYLLALAVGSARRRVVLTYSRLDAENSRPRVPSRFLGAVCSALVGADVPASLLEHGAGPSWLRRAPSGFATREPDGPSHAADVQEYDSAVFAQGGRRRTGYAAAISPWFARALALESARWHTRTFGPYDGKVHAPDLLDALRTRDAARPVSPTRFETYARCPFEYFLTHVLGVEELEEPELRLVLDPRDRGSLMHELLRDLYRGDLTGQPLGRLTDARAAEVLGHAARLLDAMGAPHALARPAVWQAEREEIMAELEAWIAHERTAHADAEPAEFERWFERAEGPVEGLSFHGRIDRIDRLPDGGVQVVDYKTGSTEPYRKASFAGGRQLQLPIYLEAAARALNASHGRALYAFLRGPKDVEQHSLNELRERREEFGRVVTLIRDGIASGNFMPVPCDKCPEHCICRPVCGGAITALGDIKQADPDARPLQDLRAIK